ncbi:MAG: LutC/YkgG family protein [Phycisphaerae bacterium]
MAMDPNQQPLGHDSGRSVFLTVIRHALGHSAQGAPPAPAARPKIQEKLLRQVPAGDSQRVERWIQQARANGLTVVRTNADGIHAAIEHLLSGHSVKSIMLNVADLPEDALAGRLQAGGYQIHLWTDPNCENLVFQCDAGITDCRYGLADTGALLVWSDPGFGRSTTLTIPLHIVLVPAARIVADMIDALPHLLRDTGGRMPSNAVIINGPSKTADIEMNLVTGVHGPKYLYAIVID